MRALEEVMQFLLDALSANAAKGESSVVTIRVAPFTAKERKILKKRRVVTNDDVLDAHEMLETFDGDFQKIFENNNTPKS